MRASTTAALGRHFEWVLVRGGTTRRGRDQYTAPPRWVTPNVTLPAPLIERIQRHLGGSRRLPGGGTGPTIPGPNQLGRPRPYFSQTHPEVRGECDRSHKPDNYIVNKHQVPLLRCNIISLFFKYTYGKTSVGSRTYEVTASVPQGSVLGSPALEHNV